MNWKDDIAPDVLSDIPMCNDKCPHLIWETGSSSYPICKLFGNVVPGKGVFKILEEAPSICLPAVQQLFRAVKEQR